MPSDTQDWVSGINVEVQDLAQLIVRPKYGGAQFSEVSGAVGANTKTYALAISGKGVIYGVYAWVKSTASQEDDYFGATVDGEDVPLPTFKESLNHNFIRHAGVEAQLSVFDEVNWRYGGTLNFGKTFESSFIIYYAEAHGRNPTVSLMAYYALITS